MQRTLQSERLDSLAPDDPAAIHNRRDLRLTNAVMGNHRWIARTLAARLIRGERVLELGAGTGELGSRLERCQIVVDGLDRWPRPAPWPAGAAWHQADLRHFDGYTRYTAVVGNLIFHQFTEAELAALGSRFGPTVRLIVACEPRRRRLSQVLFRAAGTVFGANEVSLHDAHVSIAAGFRGVELPRALGLAPDVWRWEITTTALGAYRLVAVRHSR